MAITIDPGALRTRAGSLRTIANNLDSTRSEISQALAMIGKSSGSNAALSGVVSSLRTRALDLEYRASFVERFQPIEMVATAPSWNPTTYDTLVGSSLQDARLLIDDLGYRIDNWAGSDNDPILDELIATKRAMESSAAARAATPLAQIEQEIAELEAISGYVNVAVLITEKKAELADLTASKAESLRQAIATMQSLESIPHGGTEAISALYHQVQVEVETLQIELGVTADDFRAAVAAMREGMTPGEVGLSPLLFDPAYLERTALVEDAQAEVSKLESALAHLYWLADNEIPAELGENRLLDSLVLEEAIEDAAAHVDDVRRQIVPSIGDLSAWIAGFDLVRGSTGDAVFAETLIASTIDGDSAGAVAIADALGRVDAAAAGAFFNQYGPDGTANLPWAIIEQFHYEYGEGVDTLRRISIALADAQRAGHLSFSGSELMNQIPGGYLPANLFRFGNFTSGYLAEAGAFMVGNGDRDRLYGIAGFDTPSLMELGDPWPFDPRLMILERVAEDPAASLRMVETLAGNDQLRLLIDPEVEYLNTEGAAVGEVLVHVGVAAAGEDTGGRFTDLLAQVVLTTSQVDGTQKGVADGLTTMLAPHLGAVVPFNNGNSFNGYHRDLDPIPLNDVLASLGLDENAQDQAFDALLDVIVGGGGVDLLEANVTNWIAFQTLSLYDPTDPRSFEQWSDDFGGLMGVYLDAEFDGELATAEARDKTNKMYRTITSIATSAALSYGTGGIGFFVGKPVTKWAASRIASQGIGWLRDGFLPTDNGKKVLLEQVNAIHEDISEANLLFIELQGSDYFEVPYRWYDDLGHAYLPPDPADFNDWKNELIEAQLEAGGHDTLHRYDFEVEAIEEIYETAQQFVGVDWD